MRRIGWRALPTSGWTDIWQQQHSLAFVVAGAQTDALLTDFYNALLSAKENGTGYAAFKESFDAIVGKHKWAYNGTPGWRSKVIYDTNMQAAYSAGRWQQQWALRDEMPYLQYVHTTREHPRLEHKSWNGKILPITSPWWDTHYAPNGWGCKCRIDPLTRSQAEREWTAAGKTGPDPEPEVVWEDRIVGKTTSPKVVRTPVGIDPGFAYNPGKAYLEPHTVPPFDGYGGNKDTPIKFREEEGFDLKKWPKGTPRPRAPKPTVLKKSALYDESTPALNIVSDFLSVFGATLEQGSVFFDASETPLVVSKALFVKGEDKNGGSFKWDADPAKRDRLKYANLMAMALSDPDEIWWRWDMSKSSDTVSPQWRLKRRYIKLFDIEGSDKFALVSFEWDRTAWRGSTTFLAKYNHAKEINTYLDTQRTGRLVFKK